MANRISPDKQIRILNMLVEGTSMRSITRIENCGINTVKRLVAAAGKACIDYHDEHVREVSAQVVQCDEIWAFVYAKRRNVEHAVAAPDEARRRVDVRNLRNSPVPVRGGGFRNLGSEYRYSDAWSYTVVGQFQNKSFYGCPQVGRQLAPSDRRVRRHGRLLVDSFLAFLVVVPAQVVLFLNGSGVIICIGVLFRVYDPEQLGFVIPALV